MLKDNYINNLFLEMDLNALDDNKAEFDRYAEMLRNYLYSVGAVECDKDHVIRSDYFKDKNGNILNGWNVNVDWDNVMIADQVLYTCDDTKTKKFQRKILKKKHHD